MSRPEWGLNITGARDFAFKRNFKKQNKKRTNYRNKNYYYNKIIFDGNNKMINGIKMNKLYEIV